MLVFTEAASNTPAEFTTPGLLTLARVMDMERASGQDHVLLVPSWDQRKESDLFVKVTEEFGKGRGMKKWKH